MWHVYILKCGNGSLYTGITDNLERRFREHASGKGGHFTKSFGAVKILYSEKCSGKSSVLKREARIKSLTRSKKIALIEGRMYGLADWGQVYRACCPNQNIERLNCEKQDDSGKVLPE